MKLSRLVPFVVVSLASGSVLACAGKTVDAGPTAEQDAGLRDRWNVAAKAVHATIAGSTLDFTWTETAFPAPTYRGGSEAAYEEFAEILILFYSIGDNLDFAKTNGLLTQEFGDGLSGDRGGSTWTLRGMTRDLTTPGALSNLVRPETVAKLRTYCPSVGCDSATGH